MSRVNTEVSMNSMTQYTPMAHIRQVGNGQHNATYAAMKAMRSASYFTLVWVEISDCFGSEDRTYLQYLWCALGFLSLYSSRCRPMLPPTLNYAVGGAISKVRGKKLFHRGTTCLVGTSTDYLPSTEGTVPSRLTRPEPKPLLRQTPRPHLTFLRR